MGDRDMSGKLRGVYAVALTMGLTYYFVRNTGIAGPLLFAWKGAGVALLAAWCAGASRSFDGWLIAGTMALGALGDVLIETSGLTAGALAFMAGHVLALALYLRNQRPGLTLNQHLGAALVVPLSVFIAITLVPPQRSVGIAAYTFLVAAMAASAWSSRFPRTRVGMGAMMFLASDLLIFARIGLLARSSPPELLIWPLYFAGQALIASGVVRTLRTADRGITP